MAIPYSEALDIIGQVALKPSSIFAKEAENVPILRTVGRICGTVAAGDAPSLVSNRSIGDCYSCVEIATGAQFPISGPEEPSFDACIKVEDTANIGGPDDRARYIQVTKPARPNQNRRFAGSDFEVGEQIMSPGTTIQPQHIMALAALGIAEISVFRKPRVGILSTGSELLSHDVSADHDKDQIRDSNAPYLEAVLSRLGVDVTYFGIVKDSSTEFQKGLSKRLLQEPYDVVITTGAVSMGKFDFVKEGITAMGAEVHFHKVAIRPGHPVLFATLPRMARMPSDGTKDNPPSIVSGDDLSNTSRSKIGFFGLPGNPIAAAVCLRFLVIPYLRSLHSVLPLDRPIPATLAPHPSTLLRSPTKPLGLQVFWHGNVYPERREVTISTDQGPSKLKPLLRTNCWVSIPAKCGRPECGDVIETFELYPSSLGS